MLRYQRLMVFREGRKKPLLFQWFDQIQKMRYSEQVCQYFICFIVGLTLQAFQHAMKIKKRYLEYLFQVGFLSDRRRMNVAVTRARRQCCIVCDTETVSSDGFLKRLVEYFEEHGEYQSASEYQNVQVKFPKVKIAIVASYVQFNDFGDVDL